MAEIVYILCAGTSVACATMLLRQFRRTQSVLVFWTSICFLFLAMNNVILFLDFVVFPEIDFGGPILRNLSNAAAGSVLLFGLVWEVR